jgi:uncharacterized glyoxalase superfamily protein PhnB
MLAVEVSDVDTWHHQLAGDGVTIVSELEAAPWGHRRFAIEDPDGFRIWLYQDIGD